MILQKDSHFVYSPRRPPAWHKAGDSKLKEMLGHEKFRLITTDRSIQQLAGIIVSNGSHRRIFNTLAQHAGRFLNN